MYSILESNLGYKFNDQELVTISLTHKSVGMPNNERLEFLGDGIVNFIIAELLYKMYQDLDEGELTRSRACLIKGAVFAELALELQVDQFLILGPGEEKNLGRARQSILANTLEAIIAAIYLDCNDYKLCKDVISKWFDNRIKFVNHINLLKDPKTLLQEYTQSSKLPLPRYSLVSAKGKEHEKKFVIQCEVKTLGVTTGMGNSKKSAEQQAATSFINRIYKHDRSN